jgi:lysophospholipase L1-like esterase
MRSLARNAAFMLIALVIGLGAMEGAAQLVEGQLPPLRPLPAPGSADCMPDCLPDAAPLPVQPRGLPRGIAMQPHGTRSWALRPNMVMLETHVRVRVNSLGLRGPELEQKQVDELRLLTVGDSSVFGFGVEEDAVFSTIAAKALARDSGLRVTAVNGGTPGYTTEQAKQLLADVGQLVQPDWVIIACIWSDLFQTDVPVQRQAVARVPLALYRLAIRGLTPWLSAPTVGWVDGELGAPGLGREARVGLERYQRNLDELVLQTTRLGARPLFLLLPAPSDLDAVPAPVFIRAYREAMRAAAAEADAPLVDGPQLFRTEGGGNGDFYDQVHPSTTGHARLGRALAAALEDGSGA